MNIKKILFSLFTIFTIASTTKSMFVEENQPEEDIIFRFIRDTDINALQNYLNSAELDLNNIFSLYDRTPLQEAIILYNIHFRRLEKKEKLKEIVKLLLDKGADINAKRRSGKHPAELNEALFVEILTPA